VLKNYDHAQLLVGRERKGVTGNIGDIVHCFCFHDLVEYGTVNGAMFDENGYSVISYVFSCGDTDTINRVLGHMRPEDLLFPAFLYGVPKTVFQLSTLCKDSFRNCLDKICVDGFDLGIAVQLEEYTRVLEFLPDLKSHLSWQDSLHTDRPLGFLT